MSRWMDAGEDERATAKPGRLAPVLQFAGTLALVFFLWFAFVGTKALHEMEVGAAASLLTAVFTLFVCRESRLSIHIRAADLAEIWRVVPSILSDTWLVTVVLLRDLLRISRAESLARVCGFEPVREDAVSMGRRVLLTVYASAAPNAIVIGVDSERRRLLFHQLRRSGVTVMMKRLGARP